MAARRRFVSKRGGTAQLVRDLRQRLGLTQEKMAARLGVTFPTINRWENGRAKPSPLALKQIEDLLVGLGDNGQDLRAKYFTKEGI
jgi:putative transcriptional regulator